MARSLQPIPASGLSIPRANVLIGDVGGDHLVDVGDVEAFSLSLEVDEVDRYGKNSSTKTLRRSDVIKVTATVKMTIVDMTRFMRALSVAATESGRYVQSAAVATEARFAGVVGGRVYKVPHLRLSGVSVTDGSGRVFTPGVNVVVLEDSGYIQVLSTPVGADGEMVVTYSAPEIAAADDVLMAGVGSDFNVRKSIHVVGINKIGPRDMLVLHDVQLRHDGDRAFQGEDDYAQMTLTGKVFQDPSQPEGLELGHLITID